MIQMKKTSTIACLLAVVALLGACESARKVFSSDKTAPDEFAVYSRPPLSLPPEYKLRPPTPGSSRPQGETAKFLAEKAILGPKARSGNQAKAVKGSTGVRALLRDTGALTASADIRTVINEETSILAERDQVFVNKLIFWVDDKPFQGTIVDAEKEQKRIQKNQALGRPVTDGETPEIKVERGRKGLLNF